MTRTRDTSPSPGRGSPSPGRGLTAAAGWCSSVAPLWPLPASPAGRPMPPRSLSWVGARGSKRAPS